MAYEPNEVLDCSGMSCPMPILKTKKAVDKLEPGQILKMIATDPGSKPDMEAWSKKTGHKLLEYQQDGDKHIFFIEKV
ncbi:MAG: sulfurtransferase TusA family protein [Chloroflexi bacterium]|nr:sulfurtransferase TusA family protein [Chloroflexota bacterium]